MKKKRNWELWIFGTMVLLLMQSCVVVRKARHHPLSGELAAAQLCSLLRHIHSAGIADVGTSAAARHHSALPR